MTAAQDLANGIAAQNLGHYGDATKDYQAVLKIQPRNAFALFDLGDVEQFQHQFADAQQHYLAALSINPRLESAMFNLATLVATSNPGEAKALYEQVLSLSPNDADAHLNLGYVLISLGQRSAGQAEISRSVTLNLASGISAQNAGKYSTAEAHYRSVLRVQPKNAYALFDLGDLEQFQHLTAAAEANYHAALAANPHFVAASYNLAILVATSNPGEAKSLYLQVLRASPNNAFAHFNLGFVLIALGQRAAGNAEIATAIRLDPSLKSRVPK